MGDTNSKLTVDYFNKFDFGSGVRQKNDDENFNNLIYKFLEWVIVRPKFFSLEGGQLVKRKIWYNAESEFIKILKKYSIPYSEENGAYIIYGYK